MSPEKAGLATLRAQLGYTETSLAEKEGTVRNRMAELARAQEELAVVRQRHNEYLEAIRILEANGYAEVVIEIPQGSLNLPTPPGYTGDSDE